MLEDVAHLLTGLSSAWFSQKHYLATLGDELLGQQFDLSALSGAIAALKNHQSPVRFHVFGFSIPLYARAAGVLTGMLFAADVLTQSTLQRLTQACAPFLVAHIMRWPFTHLTKSSS
jgi:hypothetical protein